MDDAPSITSSAPTSATEETAYNYTAVATDPESDPLTWSLASADTCGGAIDSGGTYTFTPAGPTPPSDCVVSVEACDPGNLCAVQTTTVAITAVNDAPSITSTAPTTATEDTAYTYQRPARPARARPAESTA